MRRPRAFAARRCALWARRRRSRLCRARMAAQVEPVPGQRRRRRLRRRAARSPRRWRIRWCRRRRSCFRQKFAVCWICGTQNNRKTTKALMFNPLKLQEMLGQAKQMQEQVQQKLAASVVEASSGGGAITVRMNGKKEVLKVTIDPSAVASLTGPNADVEMLEDLVAAAFNEAGRRAEEIMKSTVQGMMGGLNLPPGLI